MTRHRALRLLDAEFKARGYIVISEVRSSESSIDSVVVDTFGSILIFANDMDRADGDQTIDSMSAIRQYLAKKMAEKFVQVVHILLTGEYFIVKMITNVDEFVELYNVAKSETIQHNTLLSVEECVNEIERITGRES